MARCIVIGSSERANNTIRALQEGCLQAKIVYANDHAKIIGHCKREHGLKVIVVFYNDIQGDGIDFLQKLRDSMPSVHIRVLKKGDVDARPTDDELNEIPVDEVFSSSSPSQIIAKSIMKRLFDTADKDGKTRPVSLGRLDKAMFNWPQNIIKIDEPAS